MNIKTYKLIDTSIKIGLSALITGVITYFITSKNNENIVEREKVKFKRELRIKILNEASVHTSEIFNINYMISNHLLNTKYWKYHGKIKNLKKEQQKKHQKVFTTILQSIKHMKIVESKLKIIGANTSYNELFEYNQVLKNYLNKINENEIDVYNKTHFNELSEKMDLRRENFYKEINKYFNSL